MWTRQDASRSVATAWARVYLFNSRLHLLSWPFRGFESLHIPRPCRENRKSSRWQILTSPYGGCLASNPFGMSNTALARSTHINRKQSVTARSNYCRFGQERCVSSSRNVLWQKYLLPIASDRRPWQWVQIPTLPPRWLVTDWTSHYCHITITRTDGETCQQSWGSSIVH